MAYIGLETGKYERTAGTAKSTPLPPGMYHGIVTRTQLKPTKEGDGQYLEVEFDISFPAEFSNRKFWDRFNIINKSQEATRIGKEQLSDLVKATGLATLGDDTELQGKEVALILRVEPSKNPKYPDPKNECSKYWPVGTSMAQHDEWRKKGAKPQVSSGVAPQQAAAPAKSPSPWARAK